MVIFSEFYAISGCHTHFKSELRRSISSHLLFKLALLMKLWRMLIRFRWRQLPVLCGPLQQNALQHWSMRHRFVDWIPVYLSARVTLVFLLQSICKH